MQDNEPINLTYGQVSDMVNRIEQIPPLTGSGAPTAQTPAFYTGQTYVDTDTNDVYVCKEIDDTASPTTYTWGAAGSSYTAGEAIDITNDVISATNTGKAKVLTTDDYNYPTTGTKTRVALWLLDDGIYYVPSEIQTSASTMYAGPDSGLVLVSHDHRTSNGLVRIDTFDTNNAQYVYLDHEDGSPYNSSQYVLLSGTVQNNLTSTSGTMPLAANQGRVLKSQIGDLASLTTTDKTNLVAAINEAAASGGGSGVIELTSADYNYPTNNPNSVALWKLDEGLYSWDTSIRSKIKISTIRNANDTTSDGALVMRPSTADSREIYLFGDGDTVSTSFGRNTLHFYKVTTSTGVTTNTDNIFFVTGKDLVSSTGNSPTSAMSQYGATKMIYYDTNDKTMIQIGAGANASVSGVRGVAIGQKATANGASSIALGSGATTPVNVKGVMSIGSNATGHTTNGYNNSQYRLLTGLYDPQSDHDAATKGYVDPTTDSSAPTTATIGRLGQIYIDTSTATAYMCVAADTATPSYTWKQITA